MPSFTAFPIACAGIPFAFNSSTSPLFGRKPRERTTASASTVTSSWSLSLSSTTPFSLISFNACASINCALYFFSLPHTSATFVWFAFGATFSSISASTTVFPSWQRYSAVSSPVTPAPTINAFFPLSPAFPVRISSTVYTCSPSMPGIDLGIMDLEPDATSTASGFIAAILSAVASTPSFTSTPNFSNSTL